MDIAIRKVYYIEMIIEDRTEKEGNDITIAYYNCNAEQFADSTADVVFSDVQDRFLNKLQPGSFILDFGCGAGRDSLYFIKKGYQVDAVDGSEKLCEIAGRNTGLEVRKMLFSDLNECEKYDGIWACASVLHLPKEELYDVFKKMICAVKTGGYIYTSFKYGDQEGFRSGRYFTDFTEGSFRIFVEDHSLIKIDECWVSWDVRPGRSEEKWLNIILKKQDTD